MQNRVSSEMLFLITLSSPSNRRVSLHIHTPSLSYGASNFRDYIVCYVMMISLWLIFDDDVKSERVGDGLSHRGILAPLSSSLSWSRSTTTDLVL